MREDIRLGNEALTRQDLDTARQYFQQVLVSDDTVMQKRIAANRLREIDERQQPAAEPRPRSPAKPRTRRKPPTPNSRQRSLRIALSDPLINQWWLSTDTRGRQIHHGKTGANQTASLRAPYLIAGFGGWPNGGNVSTDTVYFLQSTLKAEQIGEITSDDLYIYSSPTLASRPITVISCIGVAAFSLQHSSPVSVWAPNTICSCSKGSNPTCTGSSSPMPLSNVCKPSRRSACIRLVGTSTMRRTRGCHAFPQSSPMKR